MDDLATLRLADAPRELIETSCPSKRRRSPFHLTLAPYEALVLPMSSRND